MLAQAKKGYVRIDALKDTSFCQQVLAAFLIQCG